MKKRVIIALCMLIAGCATNTQHIYAFGSLVYCHGTVDKPVEVRTDVSPSGNTFPLVP